MFDIDNPGELLEAECQIGDTRFHLDKMGAMEAWRVLEVIRKEASNVAGLPITDLMTQLRGATMDDAIRIGAKVALAVIGLPVPFVEGLRKTLFKHVRFTGNGAQTPQMLMGAEDMAFNGLEPVAIYEVLVRSLAVNFTPSFAGLAGQICKVAPPSGRRSKQA